MELEDTPVLGSSVASFAKEGSDIILESPMQAGMYRYIQERPAVIDKKIGISNNVLNSESIKKIFGKIKGKGLNHQNIFLLRSCISKINF